MHLTQHPTGPLLPPPCLAPPLKSVCSPAGAPHVHQPRRVSAWRDAVAARPDAHGGQPVGVKTTACRPQGAHRESQACCDSIYFLTTVVERRLMQVA